MGKVKIPASSFNYVAEQGYKLATRNGIYSGNMKTTSGKFSWRYSHGSMSVTHESGETRHIKSRKIWL